MILFSSYGKKYNNKYRSVNNSEFADFDLAMEYIVVVW